MNLQSHTTLFDFNDLVKGEKVFSNTIFGKKSHLIDACEEKGRAGNETFSIKGRGDARTDKKSIEHLLAEIKDPSSETQIFILHGYGELTDPIKVLI